jgi:hypothetical protein
LGASSPSAIYGAAPGAMLGFVPPANRVREQARPELHGVGDAHTPRVRRDVFGRHFVAVRAKRHVGMQPIPMRLAFGVLFCTPTPAQRFFRRYPTPMRIITALALALLSAALSSACSKDVQALDAQQIEQQYGISGAYPQTITTSDGPIKGMLVPITLANGRRAHLFIPQRQASDQQAVYVQDEQGLHPVLLSANASREALEAKRARASVRRPAASAGSFTT